MGATGNKNFVGLDIGSHSFKLVQLEQSRKGLKLVRFVVRRLPPDIVAGGEILNGERLKTALGDLLLEQKLTEARAGMALPGVRARVALVKLPLMSDEELKECMAWECRQRLGLSSEEAAIDYQVLVGGNGGSGGQISLLLAGTKRETLAGYLQVMRETALNLSEVSVCPLILTDAYNYSNGSGRGQGLLVHAGAEVIELVVLKDGIPVFVRGLRGGGNEITRSLEAGLSTDFESAESLKMGKDIPRDMSEEVERIVERGAEELVSRIKQAVEDYVSLGGIDTGDRVILSGGCSKLSAFSRQLKKQLSVRLEYFNPFKKVTYNKKFNPQYVTHYAPEAAVAVGLALKGTVT